jgi:hypothetical protein
MTPYIVIYLHGFLLYKCQAEHAFQASTPTGIQTVFLISRPVGTLVTFVGRLVLDSL